MIVVHRTRGDMSFFKVFAHTVVISRKTVKSGKNTICDICAHNSWRYEICNIFSHTVVLAIKRSNQVRMRFVTLVHKTRGDMSFVKFFVHTVVISCKTVKSANNTICDT